MKALVLIFTAFALITSRAYAEKAPLQPRTTKVSPRIVRVKPPVRTVVPAKIPKPATDPVIINAPNSVTPQQSTDTARTIRPNQTVNLLEGQNTGDSGKTSKRKRRAEKVVNKDRVLGLVDENNDASAPEEDVEQHEDGQSGTEPSDPAE
ncbi:MAG: hypothetical protein H7175_06010 [Burkholderiales bacterium]|nr:hypothetical protein [Anaerolineae bacterium]